MSLGRIAEITGGSQDAVADPETLVSGPVVIDSREVRPGALFVAIKGERVDGHDFAPGALEAGAAAVLTTRPAGVPAIVVADPVEALGMLARAVASAISGLRIVGVTGSSGKTTTKDLIARLARRLSPGGDNTVVAAAGSYNNEIGHPLTVLRADGRTRYLVLELGARSAGHITKLMRIAPPSIGVVLNVGSAHLGIFGGKEAIARAKGELVEGLPGDGVAVLNADDPSVDAMAARTPARVVRFGRAAGAGVRAEDVRLGDRGRAAFTLVTPEGRVPVRLRIAGEHIVEDALAAAAAARALGLSTAAIAEELSAAEPASRWRMEVTDRRDGTTVINDAYNANPHSLRAALEALVAIAGGRRKIVVLGAMRELGPAADEENERAGRLAAEAGADPVIAVGEGAGPILAGAGQVAVHAPDVEAARHEAERGIERASGAGGAVVLVKGPRVMNLQRVAEALAGPEDKGAGTQPC